MTLCQFQCGVSEMCTIRGAIEFNGVLLLVEYLQMLTIHLEETDCFAAWVSAREVGIGQPSGETSDPKCMLSFHHLLVLCLVVNNVLCGAGFRYCVDAVIGK